jgi:ketosteroid isomerase-like protein
MEPEEFKTHGDLVAVAVRYRARGRGSGLGVEGRESALWTIRGGRSSAMRGFTSQWMRSKPLVWRTSLERSNPRAS